VATFEDVGTHSFATSMSSFDRGVFGGGRLAVVEMRMTSSASTVLSWKDYVAKPSRSGVLVLDVDSLPSNTRCISRSPPVVC